jgi:hypothetical protein
VTAVAPSLDTNSVATNIASSVSTLSVNVTTSQPNEYVFLDVAVNNSTTNVGLTFTWSGGGLTWSARYIVGNIDLNSQFCDVCRGYAFAANPGTYTATITIAGGPVALLSLIGYALQGCNTQPSNRQAPFDGDFATSVLTASNGGGSATTETISGVTTANPNDMLTWQGCTASGSGFPLASGFLSIGSTTQSSTTGFDCGVGYETTSSPVINQTFTSSLTVNSWIVVFDAVAGNPQSTDMMGQQCM